MYWYFVIAYRGMFWIHVATLFQGLLMQGSECFSKDD